VAVNLFTTKRQETVSYDSCGEGLICLIFLLGTVEIAAVTEALIHAECARRIQ